MITLDSYQGHDKMISIMKKELYSLTEVAKILKVSRQAIHDRIKRGTLEAQKIGEIFVIPKHEVDRMRAEKR